MEIICEICATDCGAPFVKTEKRLQEQLNLLTHELLWDCYGEKNNNCIIRIDQQDAQDVYCSDKKQYACSKQSCRRSITRLLQEEKCAYRAVGRGTGMALIMPIC